MTRLRTSLAWQNLTDHAAMIKPLQFPLAAPERKLSLQELRVDCSRHWVNNETIKLLQELLLQQNFEGMRSGLFNGAVLNNTEKRPALHTALRALSGPHADEVKLSKERLYAFADDVRKAKKYKSIVNIGIGGSDLGPRLAVEALKPYHDMDCAFHFVSNIDRADLEDVLQQCDPATTLFIFVSKTFTTIETLTNAHSARQWLVNTLGEAAVADHFVAVSTALDQVEAFGISSSRVFGFWDWVGGRYSVWSAVGLSLILAIGPQAFEQFLAGARAMDQHFREAPFEQNIPVMLGLLGVWYRSFMKLPVQAVLPYDQRLLHLPRYLQQLDMESNGKSVDRDGQRVDYETGAILFGEVGTNGQHAFYQLLHQGTTIVPADFIITQRKDQNSHDRILLANALAQPDALWRGRSHSDPHKCFEGRRPSTIIQLPCLDPFYLGMLLALYEHKVFVQSVCWHINAFDQFGVELGKEMAQALLK